MPEARRIILYFAAVDRPLPDLVSRWAAHREFSIEATSDQHDVATSVLRGRGSLLLIDDSSRRREGVELVARLKGDPSTAIIPVTILTDRAEPAAIVEWFEAGADEVLSPSVDPAVRRVRLDTLMLRTARDVAVHPSTRLPGTNEIERAVRRRLDDGQKFAVCYADLDHFKEFNDRYSYYDGDRVIFILSRILHDVVRGLLGSDGFVGHIGGDDFIFIAPLAEYAPVCVEILAVFDELIPLQYGEQDRRAGYFFGKDRRGQLHRVPLMTLSIGVVTNEHRRFMHPAQVSELATEMKSYAKTLPGSLFVADRRRDETELRSGPGGRDARST